MSNEKSKNLSWNTEEGIDHAKNAVGSVLDNGEGEGKEGEEIDPDHFS